MPDGEMVEVATELPEVSTAYPRSNTGSGSGSHRQLQKDAILNAINRSEKASRESVAEEPFPTVTITTTPPPAESARNDEAQPIAEAIVHLSPYPIWT